MKKIKKMDLIRTVVQIIFFVLLPGLFISIYTSIKSIFMSIVHQTSSFEALLPDLLLVAAVVPLNMVLGRFFCGWMCAFGGLQDWLFALSRKVKKRQLRVSEKADFWLKGIKYAILGAAVVFIWTLQIVALPAGYNPWDVFGMLVSFSNMPNLGMIVTDFLPATIILSALIVGSFFIERFFCRYFCPLGAFFSLVSRLRPLVIHKERSNCGPCRLCTAKCSVGIPLYSKDVIRSGECINCFKCVEACPKANPCFKFTKLNINPAGAGIVAVAVMAGLLYAGTFVTAKLDEERNEAQLQEEIVVDPSVATKKYTDGTYEGSGTGFRGDMKLSVVVKDGIISAVSVVSSDDDAEFFEKAMNQIVPQIIQTQSAEVDAVSGATYSSDGIIQSVKSALSQAGGEISQVENTETSQEMVSETPADSGESNASAIAPDGVYEGSGTGFRGAMTVQVTVSGGKITDVQLVSTNDDQKFLDRAVKPVVDQILSQQSAKVDAVSGATYSSNGIMEAVANALNLPY